MCRSDDRKHSFLSFPGEIRNHIYSYLFDDQVLELDYKPKHVKIGNPRLRALKFDLHLLLTCRLIEKEVDGFIFDRCTFSFHSHQALRKFVDMVSDADLARIHKLSLSILFSNASDMYEWNELIENVVLKRFDGLRYVGVDLHQQKSGDRAFDETTCDRVCTSILKLVGGIKEGMFVESIYCEFS